jgi:hypothetical protein
VVHLLIAFADTLRELVLVELARKPFVEHVLFVERHPQCVGWRNWLVYQRRLKIDVSRHPVALLELLKTTLFESLLDVCDFQLSVLLVVFVLEHGALHRAVKFFLELFNFPISHLTALIQ